MSRASSNVQPGLLGYPELRQALHRRIQDVGDFFDRGDVGAARRAMRYAAAVDAELSSGDNVQSPSVTWVIPNEADSP